MTEPDLDYVVDEERDRNGFGPSALAAFCDKCGYLIEAHWSTASGKQTYACPYESDAVVWWGR